MKSPAWVLFRGLGREASHWGQFATDLGALFPEAQLFTPDFPGTGKRLNEPSPTTIEALVDAVRSELASDLADRPLWLLGLSLGGMVALSWAQRFPGEVAGVAAVSSSAGGISPPWKRLQPAALATVARVSFARQAAERELQTLLITSCNVARQDEVLAEWTRVAGLAPVSRTTLRRQLLGAIRFRPQLRPKAFPALIVAGARDRLVHPDCARDLAAALGVPVALHPDSGHDVPLDQPAWLLQQLEMWAKPKMSQSRR